MDPKTALDTVTTALVLGAQTGLTATATEAVKEAYASLKALLLRKFPKPDTAEALTAVEKKPESDGRKTTLREELAQAGVDHDQELVQASTSLLALLEQANPGITGGLVGQVNAPGGKVIIVNTNTGKILA